MTFFKRPIFVSPVIAPIQLLSFSFLNPDNKILRSIQSSSESHHSRGLPHFLVLQIKTLQCWTLSGKLSNCLMWYLQSLSCELAQFSRLIPPSALISPQLHCSSLLSKSFIGLPEMPLIFFCWNLLLFQWDLTQMEDLLGRIWLCLPVCYYLLSI